MQADTDLAMVMLESSSTASEAAARLDSIRVHAEASKAVSLCTQQRHKTIVMRCCPLCLPCATDQ